MMILPLSFLKRRFLASLAGIEHGTLRIRSDDGVGVTYGGVKPGPDVTVTVHDWNFLYPVVARGDIGMGETFVDGLWDTDDIEGLWDIILLNVDTFESGQLAHGTWFSRLLMRLIDRGIRRNSVAGSSRNIRAHYDVGNDFYRLWLDPTMTYSSALYHAPDVSLEAAQRAKYGRILDRIGTDAEQVLEIGCGWGGFAEEAAHQCRAVTGITVSRAQHAFANARLGSKADIRLQDYRHTEGVFDAIVSIEMFEAVGETYWQDYFRTVKARLREGGKAVIQTITIADPLFDEYRQRSDFIRHHVFPGGMLPSVTAFREQAVKAGLAADSVFAFGPDYARTLREWLVRFNAAEKDIRALGHGDAFLKTWRFYMSLCASAFQVGRTNVVQVELAHARP